MANIKGTKSFKVGDFKENNAGDRFKVVAYISAREVVIEWECGQQDTATSGNISSGGVAYYNRPSLFGVGYLGYGRFVHGNRKLKPGQQHIPSALHRHWRHLLERTVWADIKRYEDATICQSWHSLQNFLEWAVLQIGYNNVHDNGKVWCIDKDILVDGNKHYSGSTCLFVPNEVNVFFSKSEIGNTGYLGVNYIKPATKGAKEGYIARCHLNGERQYLGYYNTAKEAYNAYRVAKVEAALQLAQRWKGKVDDRVIQALLNFDQRLPLL